MLISLSHDFITGTGLTQYDVELRHTFLKMPKRGSKIRLVYVGGSAEGSANPGDPDQERGSQVHLYFPDLLSSHYNTTLVTDNNTFYEIGEITVGMSGNIAPNDGHVSNMVISTVMDIDLGVMNPDLNYIRVRVVGYKSIETQSYLERATILLEIDEGDLD